MLLLQSFFVLLLQGEKPNLNLGLKSSNSAYQKSDKYWKSEEGKKSLFLFDFFASRYGWSIEYIEELDECFLDNILLNSRKRSHYTYVSDEKDEYDNMPIDFESGEWNNEGRSFDKLADANKDAEEVLKNLEVKKPKPYDVHARMQNKAMAEQYSSGTEEAKSEMVSVIENNKRPEAQELHVEYDKLHVLINSRETSTAQKNSIAGRMAKIALELDDLGAVLKYGR